MELKRTVARNVIWNCAGMVVGLGVETFAYEINPTFVRERYREAHDLIVEAWTRSGPFHFEGTHYDFRFVNVWPRPLQRPHPPIWVPGSGSVETIRWVAERRYPFIALPYSPYQVMKGHYDLLREYAATELGYDVPPSQLGWPVLVYVAETDGPLTVNGNKGHAYVYVGDAAAGALGRIGYFFFSRTIRIRCVPAGDSNFVGRSSASGFSTHSVNLLPFRL